MNRVDCRCLTAACFGIGILLETAGTAATLSLAPTGQFPADINNLQAVFDTAEPGDIISLGSGVFNFSGLEDGDVGVTISTPNLTLKGTFATEIVGPALFKTNTGVIGFEVLDSADTTSLESLTFRDFEEAVVARGNADGLTIRGCTFGRNVVAVLAFEGGYDGHRFIGNSITLPSTSDLVGVGGLAVGLGLQGHNDVTVSENTLIGPGDSDPQSFGLLFRDSASLPRSERGIISRNNASRFSTGLQSSANDSIVEGNVVRDCETGIGIGTLTGRVATRNVRVISNEVRGNSVGILGTAVQDSLFLHNDVRQNAEAGIRFLEGSLANPPIPSTHNSLVHNNGSRDN